VGGGVWTMGNFYGVGWFTINTCSSAQKTCGSSPRETSSPVLGPFLFD
jgi:hypothetical protein